MNQLRKNAYLEDISFSHSVGTVRGKLDDRVKEHMSVAQRQVERISQEMNTRTRDLAEDLTEHIVQTNNEVRGVRQKMADLGEQISSMVTDRQYQSYRV